MGEYDPESTMPESRLSRYRFIENIENINDFE